MVRKPRPLRAGDLVGVVAPASVVDSDMLEAGVHLIEDAGYRVRVGASVRKRSGYFAGDDGERVADLQEMFADPEVKAIIAARGGYGAGRLLPALPLDSVREHAKIFVGHSDLTFLLNHVLQAAGLVAFHGPMVTSFREQPEATRNLLGMLAGERSGWHPSAREVIQPGTAEGVLVGGCLSVIVAMLGTPYAVKTRGCLLFLEDVNEKPFRVDRMLTQLRQAGCLDGVAGVVFGEMAGCTASPNEIVSVSDVVAAAFRAAPYPVAYGLPSGHGSGKYTLPLGIRARLAGERLTLLESPVAEERAA